MGLKIFQLSCLVIACFAASDKLTAHQIQPYIVNGSDAKIEEFPFIVSLQAIVNETYSVHSCAGSILNENWILTVIKLTKKTSKT